MVALKSLPKPNTPITSKAAFCTNEICHFQTYLMALIGLMLEVSYLHSM